MIHEILATYRMAKGMTLRELASKIGVPHDTLWRFEKGKEVAGKFWVKIVCWMMVGK